MPVHKQCKTLTEVHITTKKVCLIGKKRSSSSCYLFDCHKVTLFFPLQTSSAFIYLRQKFFLHFNSLEGRHTGYIHCCSHDDLSVTASSFMMQHLHHASLAFSTIKVTTNSVPLAHRVISCLLLLLGLLGGCGTWFGLAH